MKTLYVVRHADTEKGTNNQADRDRALTKIGQKTARLMAKKLKKNGVTVDAMISSTAKRARATAKVFAKELGVSTKQIELRDDLYNSITPGNHAKILQQLDDHIQSVLIVGHVPNSEKLVAYLLQGIRAADIPKSGVVCIEFDTETWSAVKRSNGRLKFVDLPLSDKQRSKAVRKNLQKRLEQRLRTSLEEVDGVAASKFQKYIKGSSAKLAAKFVQNLQSQKLTGEAAMAALRKSAAEQTSGSTSRPSARTARGRTATRKTRSARTTRRSSKPKTQK